MFIEVNRVYDSLDFSVRVLLNTDNIVEIAPAYVGKRKLVRTSKCFITLNIADPIGSNTILVDDSYETIRGMLPDGHICAVEEDADATTEGRGIDVQE